MGQYLKVLTNADGTPRFSVEQVDNYPSGQTAFAIVSTLVCATWTDYTRRRWPVLVYMSFALILSSVLILVWKTPVGVKFFAYCMCLPPYVSSRVEFIVANTLPFATSRLGRSVVFWTSYDVCVSCTLL